MDDQEKMKLIFDAGMFAKKAHGNQKYGEHPYYVHLEAVGQVLLRFGFTYKEHSSLLAAALLHDVLEDTPTNYSDVFRAFGPEVAELVYAVTDELGRNRNERHSKTYPKVLALPKAVILKLADRIANVEHSIETLDVGKLNMYRREQELFYLGIGINDATEALPMWEHLTKLFEVKFAGRLSGSDCC